MDLIIKNQILQLAQVLVVNASDTITLWTEGDERLYGWTQSDAVGKNANTLLQTVFPQPLDEIERHLTEIGEWDGTLIQTKKDGTRIKVASHWVRHTADLGQTLAILEFNHDISGDQPRNNTPGKEGFLLDGTERTLAEQWCEQITQRYRGLIENSGTGIIIVDENGQYLLANKIAADSFGKLPDEIVGKSMFDLFPEETAQKYLAFNRELLETGGRREYEDTFVMPTGVRSFLIVDQCIQDGNGRNFAVQSSSIDITDRKKAEEGLRESRRRLSHLSYRLVETQEQERHRIARELHDEIGQTITALTISLNGISQNTLDSTLSKKIENLKGLARDLIDQVNALSSDLRPRVLDDLGLIPGLISLINRLTSQTGMEVDFVHGPLEQKQIAPEIEITAYRIIQEALTNVVRHAHVKLAVVRIQIDDDTLWIQVQDEGKGFDYSTAIKSTNSMGLLSMQERAELVGGAFTIQTAHNEGTNITCRLPLGEKYIERRKNARD